MEVVHCLTLAHADERILSISRQAMNQGFALYFHEAIFAEERKHTSKAITQGHKKIIQYAKDNKLESIIVCEDDIFFYGDDNKEFQYFIDNTPTSYDLYLGCIYQGTVDENNRVLNGMSGSHSLLKIHSRFYDFILDMPDNCYQDRYCGDFSFKYEYYVCPKIVCGQMPGYSYHLKNKHNGYEVYLEQRKVYGRD